MTKNNSDQRRDGGGVVCSSAPPRSPVPALSTRIPLDPEHVAAVANHVLGDDDFWEGVVERLGRRPSREEVRVIAKSVACEAIRQLLVPDAPSKRLQ